MRRLICGALLSALFISTHVGCMIPIYHGTPERRARQLLNTSENMRLLLEEWERFWFLDQPSHLSPNPNHGGII